MSNPEPPLLAVIRDLIRERGPMSVAAYVELALSHPEHGYYRSREPFGAAGDFITAPEISQVFGELLGLWLATAWRGAGRPSPFRLVELGPGRGRLMADLVRATANVEGFLEGADIHLVENSERLRTAQREALPNLDVHWHDRFDAVPEGPLFLIANEFLDALPVHQLILTENGWQERRLTLGGDGGLAFTSEPAPEELIDLIEGADGVKPGVIAEVSPARTALTQAIAKRVVDHGGVAILIDYGAWVERPTGDTLQAVSNHQAVDPLSMPGLADLTTQVDFRSIGKAGAGAAAAVFGPVPQGPFLRALGVEPRIAALLKNADHGQGRALRSALFRLTDASAMGELFKVLVLAPTNGPLPPGFHAPTLEPRETPC